MQRYDMYVVRHGDGEAGWDYHEDFEGEWVSWEDVEIELDLKDSEIAKRDARIEELEMDIADLETRVRGLLREKENLLNLWVV